METPALADWKFWSFFVSVLALIASQLPPLRVALRKGKLFLEVYSQVYINHHYGNPHAQLHVSLSHLKGRKVRVSAITMTVSSASGAVFKLPAMSYQHKEAGKGAFLFTPFALATGDEWSHVVNFFPNISRQDDKLIKDASSALQKDIIAKRHHLEDKDADVEADPELVAPFIQLFDNKYKWFPDEYNVLVSVTTDPPNSVPDKQLRVILFDWDVSQLRSTVERYKYGIGILYDISKPEGVVVPFQSQQETR